jgi:glycosyltransferase involved in cell wall biosynthesis
MNILFIAPNVCMDCNTGDVIHVTELANSFSKRGHNVFLIARLKKSQNNDLNFLFNFESIKPINCSKLWIPHVMVSASLSALNLLISKKIDLIYERNHIFGIGVIFGKIFRIPTIVEVNGIMIDEMKMLGSFSPLTINLAQFIESFTLRNAACIVSVTEGIKKYLNENYRISYDRVVTISNGVNTDLFKPIECSKEILNLNPKFSYVCFVGNLAPWQGIEYLIKAAPAILNRFPECRFLIVGDGVMKNELLELSRELGVDDSFIFTGTVSHDRVPMYINASDICAAPFILARNAKIGLSPLKLYEYMACGKPVVASNISGVSELLETSKGGISVLPENPDALAEAILKLLENPDLRNKLGNNALSTKNNSWCSVADKILTLPKNNYRF